MLLSALFSTLDCLVIELRVVCVFRRPDLIDFGRVRTQSNKQNLEMAFSIAEKDLNITRLLDPEGTFQQNYVTFDGGGDRMQSG